MALDSRPTRRERFGEAARNHVGRVTGDHQGIANKCALRMGRVHHANRRHDAAEGLFSEIISGRLETDVDIVAAAAGGAVFGGPAAFDFDAPVN